MAATRRRIQRAIQQSSEECAKKRFVLFSHTNTAAAKCHRWRLVARRNAKRSAPLTKLPSVALADTADSLTTTAAYDAHVEWTHSVHGSISRAARARRASAADVDVAVDGRAVGTRCTVAGATFSAPASAGTTTSRRRYGKRSTMAHDEMASDLTRIVCVNIFPSTRPDWPSASGANE